MMRKILALLLLSSLLLSTAYAQEEAGESSGFTIYLVQDASAGTLTLEEDDSYTLALADAPETAQLLQTAPTLGAGELTLEFLLSGWQLSEGLAAPAVLSGSGFSLVLRLSAPRLSDEGLLLYSAAVEAYEADGEQEDKLPDLLNFGAATLFIEADGAFYRSIWDGVIESIRTQRVCRRCPPVPPGDE